MAESEKPKYDAETADENVHLATETSSPALVPDLPAPNPSPAHQIQLCCIRNC